MQSLVNYFTQHCVERSTLNELWEILMERNRWWEAHDLFQRIRRKNLEAARQGDQILEAQYHFEECCAKTVYNLSGESAPFDADSPYWIIPCAFRLARMLQIDDQEFLQIIAP
jgi:hypothetical protein